MRVRAGTPADYARIGRILELAPEAAQWTPESYEFAVADVDGSVAGFIAWRATTADEFEILNLAVDPSLRRKGVAKALLKALPSGAVFLEVRASNHAARSLYEQAGFVEAGIRPRYYQNPSEAAIVMRMQSC
jgi:ribosomal-protein-alanine N-acetyltransferase